MVRRRPSVRNVWLAQKIDDGAGTALNVLLRQSHTAASSRWLQRIRRPSGNTVLWMPTTGRLRTGDHSPMALAVGVAGPGGGSAGGGVRDGGDVHGVCWFADRRMFVLP